MEIKYTLQGLLIYIGISLYLLGFVTALLRRSKNARTLFTLGFIAAVTAVAYRWYHVEHVPMQNLFEVFLVLGMMIYPISIISRRYLGVSAGVGNSADMLLAIIVLFPAGFIFDAQPQRLPPALQCWLFAPHVAVYMLAYVFMAKAAFLASCRIVGAKPLRSTELVSYEHGTYRMVCVGFPLLTCGLLLGSWWGKLAWGDYWGWDPKELWSLASWLVYAGYFHFRYIYGKKHEKLNCFWAVVGMFVILITLLWVNLSRLFPGLHNYAT